MSEPLQKARVAVRADRLLCGSRSAARRGAGSLPQLTAPVNDFANVIDDRSEHELDRRIRALKAASGDMVVVATVKTYKPYADIDEYAVKMFENGGQGIGDKGKDNGCSLSSPSRIAGSASRWATTSSSSSPTVLPARPSADVMTPQFRSGNYGAGLLAGTTSHHQPDRRPPRRHAAGRSARPPAPRRSGIRFPMVDHHPDHHHHPQ